MGLPAGVGETPGGGVGRLVPVIPVLVGVKRHEGMLQHGLAGSLFRRH